MLTSKTTMWITFALLISFFTTSTYAEIPLKQYGEVKHSDWFKTYLYGVGVGYEWANVQYEIRRHIQPLFCEPDGVGLNAESYAQILDKYLSRHEEKYTGTPNLPLELTLLDALEDAFPCK